MLDSSHNEKLSDHSQDNSDDNSGYGDSSRDYSESSILSSDKEFGPEKSQPPHKKDGLALDKILLPWVPTFRKRVDKVMSRLLNDSMKFCTSGKMIAPPIITISLMKVCRIFISFKKCILKMRRHFQIQKFISFPLYEDILDSILPAFEQSAFGRGTATVVDTGFRNSWELNHLDFEVES